MSRVALNSPLFLHVSYIFVSSYFPHFQNDFPLRFFALTLTPPRQDTRHLPLPIRVGSGRERDLGGVRVEEAKSGREATDADLACVPYSNISEKNPFPFRFRVCAFASLSLSTCWRLRTGWGLGGRAGSAVTDESRQRPPWRPPHHMRRPPAPCARPQYVRLSKLGFGVANWRRLFRFGEALLLEQLLDAGQRIVLGQIDALQHLWGGSSVGRRSKHTERTQ